MYQLRVLIIREPKQAIETATINDRKGLLSASCYSILLHPSLILSQPHHLKRQLLPE